MLKSMTCLVGIGLLWLWPAWAQDRCVRPTVVETLICQAKTGTPQQRRSSEIALVRMGASAVPALMTELHRDHQFRWQVAMILGRIGRPALKGLQRAYLCGAWPRCNVGSRWAAGEALARIAGTETILIRGFGHEGKVGGCTEPPDESLFEKHTPASFLLRRQRQSMPKILEGITSKDPHISWGTSRTFLIALQRHGSGSIELKRAVDILRARVVRKDLSDDGRETLESISASLAAAHAVLMLRKAPSTEIDAVRGAVRKCHYDEQILAQVRRSL
jgi:hypothetical protein